MRQPAKVLSLIICLLIVFGYGLASAEEKTYVLSYSPGTSFLEFAKDRVETAYNRAGLKTNFIQLPHNRSILSANEGSVDGEVGRARLIEKEAPDLRRVDVKLMDSNGAAFTIDPKITSYEESLFKKYRVGYVQGVRWSESKLVGLNATGAQSVTALFEMLLQGRVDIVLASELSARTVFHSMGSRATRIKQLQPLVASLPLYHYVNKKNADIIPRLEQALNEINEEGVYTFYTGIQSPVFEILQQRLREAFIRIGKVCEVHSTGSSQRALIMANEQGDGDAYRNGRIKELSPDSTGNLLRIPEPIGDVKFNVYTKKKNLEVKDWNSLKDLDNGLRGGVKILEKNIPGEQLRLPDTERLLKMLAENRLDTVTEHSIVADFKIKQLQLQDITKLTPPLAAFPGYSYIHKKHKELIPAISASLAQMKEEGRFEQIEKDVFKSLLQNNLGNPQ